MQGQVVPSLAHTAVAVHLAVVLVADVDVVVLAVVAAAAAAGMHLPARGASACCCEPLAHHSVPLLACSPGPQPVAVPEQCAVC